MDRAVEPDRGDYYVAPDGHVTRTRGRWLSDRQTLARLGIDAGAAVDGEHLAAVMEGRHPDTGGWLRRHGAGGGRGGGIALKFAVPKSVSVVWALGDLRQREQIEGAHARAVQSAVLYLRDRVPVVRRRYNGQVVEERATDLIATEHRHTTTRGGSGAPAPDPHLHSHVLITGAVRNDDTFVAIASRPIFRSARELGALYRSVLAEQLTTAGYPIERGTGKSGRYFDIARVPTDLCEAFSGHSREIARAVERFRARHGRAPKPGELAHPAFEDHRAQQPLSGHDLEQVWRQTGERHAFGPSQAQELLTAPQLPPAERSIEDRIEAHLTEHHAVFDALALRAVALEQTAGELPANAALAVAQEMVQARRVLILEGGRLTTRAVRAQEHAIERRAAQLAQPAGRDAGESARASAAREVAERIGGPLHAEQNQALRLLTGPERAAVLVGPAGTGKGVVIDAAARA